MSRSQVFAGKFALVWLALGLLAGLVIAATVAGLSNAKADGHITGAESVVIDPVVVDLEPGKSRSKTEVFMRGGGFTPGTELSLLITDGNGVLSDITAGSRNRRDGGSSVFPLVANEQGAWATSWRLGRFTRRGVGGEGMGTLWVVDDEFNTLATSPIAFCNITGRSKFAKKNPDAKEVALGRLAKEIANAAKKEKDDPTDRVRNRVKIGYYIEDRNITKAQVTKALVANPGLVLAHVDDYPITRRLKKPDVVLIVVPDWCSAKPIPERG